MATFYGGEQLVRVLRLQDQQAPISADVNIYTVPSGRYAEMFINYTNVGDINDGSLIIDYANSFVNLDIDQTNPPKDDFYKVILSSGDTFKYLHGFSGSNSFVYIVTIKEYLIP